MKVLAACGVDLLLAGHVHRSYLGHTTARYPLEGYSALIIQAGTATSTRSRGEVNAFNVLCLTQSYLTVEHWLWQPAHQTFAPGVPERFRHTPQGWGLTPTPA